MCFGGSAICAAPDPTVRCCSNISQLINKANRINCHFSNYNIYIRNYRHACRQRARCALYPIQHSTSSDAPPILYTRLRCVCALCGIAADSICSLRTHDGVRTHYTEREHQRLSQKWRGSLTKHQCTEFKTKMKKASGEENKSLITTYSIKCCARRDEERFCACCNYYIIMNSEQRTTQGRR